jgi:hypothetical protein
MTGTPVLQTLSMPPPADAQPHHTMVSGTSRGISVHQLHPVAYGSIAKRLSPCFSCQLVLQVLLEQCPQQSRRDLLELGSLLGISCPTIACQSDQAVRGRSTLELGSTPQHQHNQYHHHDCQQVVGNAGCKWHIIIIIIIISATYLIRPLRMGATILVNSASRSVSPRSCR